ncbi:MAG: 3'-phosphoesterase [Acidobacteria bacterium]|nr:3'-phosphoesterase [Acidobacteriota bacterium]
MKVFRKRFVVHEHHARNLHFDLRLEIDGVLKSWAVPKGPSMRAADKRLAIAVPDHSLSYIDYEGTISEGKYGAGDVRVWDDGKYETDADPAKQLERGKIVLRFFGLKLRGEFVLVRVYGKEDQWLLIKAHDHWSDPDWKLETVLPPQQQQNKSRSRKTPAYHSVMSFLSRLSSPRREA